MLFVLGLNSKGNASLTFFYCWVDPQLSLVTITFSSSDGCYSQVCNGLLSLLSDLLSNLITDKSY